MVRRRVPENELDIDLSLPVVDDLDVVHHHGDGIRRGPVARRRHLAREVRYARIVARNVVCATEGKVKGEDERRRQARAELLAGVGVGSPQQEGDQQGRYKQGGADHPWHVSGMYMGRGWERTYFERMEDLGSHIVRICASASKVWTNAARVAHRSRPGIR